jgi:hypothetical protein
VSAAESLQLQAASGEVVELSAKRKTACALVKSKQGPLLAEALAFYQLTTGDWWMEYVPLYTLAQLHALEATTGR